VKFSVFKEGSNTPINTQQISVAAFTKDFGQESIKANAFTLPNDPGPYFLEVFVDSNNDFTEDRENDNITRRKFVVRPIPPDKTAPVIVDGSTRIENDAAIIQKRDVEIKFKADDPTSPSGQSTSGLGSFCVVRYYYDAVQRRWVEQTCNFKPLPDKDANGDFSIRTELPDRVGVAYVFVWVRDKAGNIAKTPGFDFINFIPSGARNINRNDVRVFRLRLTPGQSVSLTFTPTIGDVDATVFQGITNPARCDTSAIKNGTVAETVTVPSGLCTGTDFQIEVRAVVNSRFSVSTAVGLAAAREAQPTAAVVPALLPDATPLVGGPPALQAAIDGGAPIFLPMLSR
jgi:hypothetical protein